MQYLLSQALSLDDGGQYNERLTTALHRLELRAELYKQPDNQEDTAAMIIEQVSLFPHCQPTSGTFYQNYVKKCLKSMSKSMCCIWAKTSWPTRCKLGNENKFHYK